LQYAGKVTSGAEKFILSGNHLYLGDWSGRACLNKADGSIVWEQVGYTADDRLVLAGNQLFSTGSTNVYCFDAATGNQLWQYNTTYSADSNPILWDGRLYCVMADALRVFNPKNGKVLYENKDWGLPGSRAQGFIPQLDDMIFLPFSDEIVALRLRDL